MNHPTRRAVMNPRLSISRCAFAAVLVTLAAAPAWAKGSHGVTSTSVRSGASYGYTTGDKGRDAFSYAIVRPSSEGQGLNVNGTGGGTDWKQLNRLIERDPREVLWVKLSGHSYVTRDGDAIAKARAILAPLSRIGDKQSELGDRQSQLGDKQSAIGDQQSAIGDQQSELGDELSSINEKLAEDRGASSRRALLRRRDEIQARMAELGRQMQVLGRQQAVLGASQAALGREQSALGRQQAAASEKAQVAMRQHAEDLIAQGVFEDLD